MKKKVKVIVTGDINVRISHSMEVELEVPFDTDDEDIKQEAMAQLEAEYYENIQPILKQLDPVVAEWEIREHNEEADIQEDDSINLD